MSVEEIGKSILSIIIGIIFILGFILYLIPAGIAFLYSLIFGENNAYVVFFICTIFTYGLTAFAVTRVVRAFGQEKVILIRKERLFIFVPWLFWLLIMFNDHFTMGPKYNSINPGFEAPLFGIFGGMILIPGLFFKDSSFRIKLLILIISTLIISIVTVIISNSISPMIDMF